MSLVGICGLELDRNMCNRFPKEQFVVTTWQDDVFVKLTHSNLKTSSAIADGGPKISTGGMVVLKVFEQEQTKPFLRVRSSWKCPNKTQSLIKNFVAVCLTIRINHDLF
jgi:hypothetical protein